MVSPVEIADLIRFRGGQNLPASELRDEIDEAILEAGCKDRIEIISIRQKVMLELLKNKVEKVEETVWHRDTGKKGWL